MAEPESLTDPTPEEPKTEESKPTPASAASQQDEKAPGSKSQDREKAPASKSQEGDKVPASKADAAKPSNKPAKPKRAQPAAAAAASETLALSPAVDTAQ